jgi:hypothetical protein
MSAVEMVIATVLTMLSGGLLGYLAGGWSGRRQRRHYAAAPLHGGGPRPSYRGRREHGRGAR